MELEHRFEVPVGVDKAWPALLDLNLIGPCFPGASLDSVNGDQFTGAVKVKIGPVQLNYTGKAEFVEKDHTLHTAVIEATGGSPRSGSTATMLVHATATAIAPNRTAVELVTTLSITGRGAHFTRQMMVEVGNKLIGQFADCVSNKLTGRTAGGATLVNVTNPDEVAAEVTRSDPAANSAKPRQAANGAHPATNEPGPVLSTDPRLSPRPKSGWQPSQEPVDLLVATRAPLLKRLAPIAVGLAVLVIVAKLRRRRRNG